MRPSVVLLGFALGSAASITFALVGLAIVYGVLGPEYPRLRSELPTLLSSLLLFAGLTGAAGASFYGQLRGRPWRRIAISALLLGLAGVAWVYWPV